MIAEPIIQKAQRLYNFAVALGYSHGSAIGVCANVMAESSFDETITETGGGGGYGLGQWTPKENLYTQGSILGYTRAQCETFDVQCDILLRGDETGQWLDSAYPYDTLVIVPLTLNDYKQLTDLDTATVNYMAHWERPHEDPDINHKERRKAYAQEFDERLNGGGGGSIHPHLPVNEGTPMTDRYGNRIDPITHEPAFHAGLDFAGALNDPIYATMNGIVRIAEFNNGGLGNVIWIEHSDDNYFSAYAHLESMNVSQGDTVTRGQLIGRMGTTGYSTGIHLHFVIATELWGNLEHNTIDPEVYLQTSINPGPVGEDVDYITLLLVDALNGWKW